jgi:hypothetical protein
MIVAAHQRAVDEKKIEHDCLDGVIAGLGSARKKRMARLSY